MLTQRSANNHRRNSSQLEIENHHPNIKLIPQKRVHRKNQLSSEYKVNRKNSNQTKKLIKNSQAKVTNKKVVIEKLKDIVNEEEKQSEFFTFGKGAPPYNYRVWSKQSQMQEICEVPDTITNSQRDPGKLSLKDSGKVSLVLPKQQQFSEKSVIFGLIKKKNLKQKKKSMDHVKLKQHKIKPGGKRQVKSINSQDYSRSQSTISMSGQSRKTIKHHKKNANNIIDMKLQTKQKRNIANKTNKYLLYSSQLQQISGRTDRIEKSIKMLWQCMGQLWQNGRISKYMSEKNKQKLGEVEQGQQHQEIKLLQLENQYQSCKVYMKNQNNLSINQNVQQNTPNWLRS